MKEQSLKNRILRYLQKHGGWIASGTIQQLAHQAGYYSPANASRRCRELENDNELEVEYRKGHAWYRAKQRAKKVTYYVPELDKKLEVYA